MTELTPFLPPFFPPEISSFSGTSIAITPSGTQRGTSNPCREEVFDWVISSDLLPLNDPDTPTLLHRSTGRCFRTWVLTTYQFFYFSLSLQSFAPTSVPLPSTFRKLAVMTFSPTLTPTVLLQRNTRLFPLLLLFLPLWH